jgi:hypothetical protein
MSCFIPSGTFVGTACDVTDQLECVYVYERHFYSLEIHVANKPFNVLETL